jgi:large subunit ribosomal protein L19
MSKAAIIQKLEKESLKTDIPDFAPGDTLRIHNRIIEGTKERIQVFLGTVIGRSGSGLSETVKMYRVAYGSGMERVFLLHSPRIAKIEVVKRGRVRRAKLYYLRGAKGKRAKVTSDIAAMLRDQQNNNSEEDAGKSES